ncbi:MAG TPA: uracil-DNA glycosylase [Desulfopila sp.]|nr:uracil-DNA glycosylase [Desulfopila sp.]
MFGDDIDIVRQLRSLLRYQTRIGLKGYPSSKEIADFLTTAPCPEGQGPAAIDTPLQPSVLAEVTSVEPVDAAETMEEIAGEVATCKACDLHRHRMRAVAGRGGAGVRLLIVGGWLQTESGDDDLIFGVGEDRMVQKMLEAIHLAPEEAYVTNAIKCGIAPDVQPQADNITSCYSYLQRQISVCSPMVICTMGIVATRKLLGASQPLSQLRGRFHSYSLGQKRVIPVMPTYHPTFLLNNPEMKKATWTDLQLIAQELGK